MEFTVVLCIVGSFFLLTLLLLALSIRIVPQDTSMSVYRLGRYLGDKGPGIVILIPFIDRAVMKKTNDSDHTPSDRSVS